MKTVIGITAGNQNSDEMYVIRSAGDTAPEIVLVRAYEGYIAAFRVGYNADGKSFVGDEIKSIVKLQDLIGDICRFTGKRQN